MTEEILRKCLSNVIPFIIVLFPCFTSGQSIVSCPDIDLVILDEYDLSFYKTINTQAVKSITVDIEKNENGIFHAVIENENGETEDKEFALKNETVIDANNIVHWEQNTLKNNGFEFKDGNLKWTFSICNDFIAKVERSRQSIQKGKIKWELLDKDFYAYYFLTISDNKRILIIENTGYIIPTDQKLIVRIGGDYFSKVKLKSNSDELYEEFEINDFFYSRTEADGKESLRSKLLDCPVFNKSFDSIRFDDENIFTFDGAKCKVFSHLLTSWKIKNIRGIYRYGTLYQVLHGNKLIWVSTKGEITRPLQGNMLVCGTVESYSYSIVNDTLIIETNAQFTRDTLSIEKFRIPKLNLETIRFLNKLTKISFDGNSLGGLYSLTPNLLLFQVGNLYGLKEFNIENGIIRFTELLPIEYSSIEFLNYGHPLRIKKNGLYAYFHISNETKYKSLSIFDKFFARFERWDGRKGWLDLKGNEYLDE